MSRLPLLRGKPIVQARGEPMRGADFAGQDLRNKKLTGQNLSYCRLVDCDLRGADLSNADLSNADLTGANLEGAKLLGCILRDTRGAMRNGGPVWSIVGLQYPVLIDGAYITVGCETVSHAGGDALSRIDLIRMDRAKAVAFHPVGAALLRLYKKITVNP